MTVSSYIFLFVATMEYIQTKDVCNYRHVTFCDSITKTARRIQIHGTKFPQMLLNAKRDGRTSETNVFNTLDGCQLVTSAR